MRKVLLKLSGEVLGGAQGLGLSPESLERIAREIAEVRNKDLWLGIVVGGGNFIRGKALSQKGIPQALGDSLGMIATVLNGLALQAILESLKVSAAVLSAFEIQHMVRPYSEEALKENQGKVVIFVGGTGNPFLTTDTAAALRAAQMGASLLLKATKVDGVYSDDPVVNPGAEFLSRLTYEEALSRRLHVMDLAAITLCRENKIPIRVFNVTKPGNLTKVLEGHALGSIIDGP